MQLSEVIRQAISSLGANRLRSLLTVMGVAVGVFSIIAVMTTIDALNRSVESGLASLGSNTFQIQKYPATVFGRGHRRNLYVNRPDIAWREAQAFRRLMEGRAKTVGLSISGRGNRARYANRTTNPDVSLVGGDEHFAAANGLGVTDGRNLTESDIRYARNSAVLGADLAEALFPGSETPVGEQVRIAGEVYRVAGVFTKKGAAFGQSQDNFMLIPVTRYLSHVDAEGSLSITVEARSQEEYPRTLDAALGSMRIARGLSVGEENDFEIRTNESLIESFRDIERSISVGAFIISFMALLTAGVGIMNIMLVSVTERTREIGIRMSVGARRTSILRQFLFEAVLLSLGGGMLGAGLGAATGNLVAMQLQLPPVVPILWIAVSMAVCSAIGVGFGLFPAWKASRLDPVEALRGK